MMDRPGPTFAPLSGDRVSAHATTIAFAGAGLALCGPSGAGKSGTAAQLIALGADLVADDLTIFMADGSTLLATAPSGAVSALELRGLGLARLKLVPHVALKAFVWLGASTARLPEPENVQVLGCAVPLLRHPATADLAAKLLIWLDSRTCERGRI